MTQSEKTAETGGEYTFEQAMARLEEIVRFLEDGNASLDASIDAFSEGIGLVRFCNARLEHAEQQVKILQENGSDMTEVPFDGGRNG